jgi:hypothetical protein
VEHDRTAMLLGSAQVLVDGGRLVFERNAPDARLLRDLWSLLPTATRTDLWPASFAFSNGLRFHVLALPTATGPDSLGAVTEAQAGDYPEGRYELALQLAVESDDQADLDALFARRSRAQVLRMGVALLLAFIISALGLSFPNVGQQQAPAPSKEKEARPDPAMKLPPTEAIPALSPQQRQHFADRLAVLAKRLGVRLPDDASEEALAQAIAQLDHTLDQLPGSAKSRRDPGPLSEFGPAQRRLRALLWKHEVSEYDDLRLNPVELVERLEKKLAEKGAIKEDRGE